MVIAEGVVKESNSRHLILPQVYQKLWFRTKRNHKTMTEYYFAVNTRMWRNRQKGSVFNIDGMMGVTVGIRTRLGRFKTPKVLYVRNTCLRSTKDRQSLTKSEPFSGILIDKILKIKYRWPDEMVAKGQGVAMVISGTYFYYGLSSKTWLQTLQTYRLLGCNFTKVA